MDFGDPHLAVDCQGLYISHVCGLLVEKSAGSGGAADEICFFYEVKIAVLSPVHDALIIKIHQERCLHASHFLEGGFDASLTPM